MKIKSRQMTKDIKSKFLPFEYAVHLLGMTTAKPSRARKSAANCKIASVDEIKEIVG